MWYQLWPSEAPRQLRASSLSICFALSILWACSDETAHPLATIDAIEPGVVEPGDTVRIIGSGFVVGPATATFTGQLKPVGLADSRDYRVTVEAIATSTKEVRVQVSSRVMKQLANEESRFSGSVEVSFPNTPSGVRIDATKAEHTFDLKPTGGGVRMAAKRNRATRRFLGTLGLHLIDQKNGGDGLVVSEVVEGSAADRAGFQFGDRILSMDGTAITKPSDIAGAVSDENHSFEIVSRSGTIKQVSIEPQINTQIDRDQFTAIILSSIALGLFLSFAAPTRRRQLYFPQEQAAPYIQAIVFAMVSVPLLLIPSLTMVSQAGLAVTVTLLGVSVLGLITLFLYQKDRSFRLAIGLALHVLAPSIAMAVATVAGSAVGLDNIVSSQQETPWGFHAWSSPFALIATGAAISLAWPSCPSGRGATMATWAVAIPSSSLIVCTLLGGWLVPFFPSEQIAKESPLFAAACVIFLLKTWLVLLGGRWLASLDTEERRANSGKHPRVWPRAALLILSASAAICWLWLDFSESVRIIGRVLATAASVTLFTYLGIFGLKSALHTRVQGESKASAESRSFPATARQ